MRRREAATSRISSGFCLHRVAAAGRQHLARPQRLRAERVGPPPLPSGYRRHREGKMTPESIPSMATTSFPAHGRSLKGKISMTDSDKNCKKEVRA